MTSDTGRLQRAFDRMAPSFDTVLERNPINAWMHEANMRVLRETFASGDRLLELGCGTGNAAIELAQRGYHVFGLDISEGMVTEARRKIRALGLEERVHVVCARSRDLLQAVEQSPWKSFDGGFANFSLTYEPDLEGISRALASVLKPGGVFVCTIPNRVVLSELVVYGTQLHFDKVLRRFTKPLTREVHGSTLETYAYSPWQVRQAFNDAFSLRSVVGMPTFLPPPYLHAQYRRLGRGHRLFEALDRRLAPRFPWNQLGEHTLFVFERISTAPGRVEEFPVAGNG